MAIESPELISGVISNTNPEKQLTYKSLRGDDLVDILNRVRLSQEGETVTYYIHNRTGPEYLGSYGYGTEGWEIFSKKNKIDTLKHNDSEVSFIENIFERLDPLIDLDFERMNTYDGSAIDIYSVASIDDDEDLSILGLSIFQSSNIGSWLDVIWRDTDGKDKTNDNDLNTIVHEIGHALGLQHPFDDPWNELWSVDDTVMSYNEGAYGWNTWFTQLDIQALKSIWGRENDQGFINVNGLSSDFEFMRTNQDTYLMKGNIGVEDITFLERIIFEDQTININNDIIDVFNLIKGIDDITGQLFRLYNTIFDRFPDIEGFKYWIEMNSNGIVNLKETTNLFIDSNEFSDNFGNDISNDLFINQMYINALGRSPELEGFQYWLNQLDTNLYSRNDVALSINNSHESKLYFMENTSTTFLEALPLDVY